jgi:hypothetical protein
VIILTIHIQCSYSCIIINIVRDIIDTIVIISDATAHSNARFGQGTGSIFLDNVACTGEEDMLTSCAYDSNTADCFHSDDAGVTCIADCMFITKIALPIDLIGHSPSCIQWSVLMVS